MFCELFELFSRLKKLLKLTLEFSNYPFKTMIIVSKIPVWHRWPVGVKISVRRRYYRSFWTNIVKDRLQEAGMIFFVDVLDQLDAAQ